MKKDLNAKLVVVSIMGLAALSGCGKGPDASAPPAAAVPAATTTTPTPVATTTGTSVCSAGQYPLYYGCAAVSDFNTACLSQGGIVNGTVCKVQFSLLGLSGFSSYYSNMSPALLMNMNYVPILTPANPVGMGSLDLGFQVFSHDHLSFSASGGWGSSQANVHTWGPFTFYTSSSSSNTCSQINLNGTATQGSSLPANAGAAPGLMGSDGTEVFALGSHVEKDISNHGSLKIGFNTAVAQDGCTQFYIQKMSITRCFDASGATLVCQ